MRKGKAATTTAIQSSTKQQPSSLSSILSLSLSSCLSLIFFSSSLILSLCAPSWFRGGRQQCCHLCGWRWRCASLRHTPLQHTPLRRTKLKKHDRPCWILNTAQSMLRLWLSESIWSECSCAVNHQAPFTTSGLSRLKGAMLPHTRLPLNTASTTMDRCVSLCRGMCLISSLLPDPPCLYFFPP